MTDGPHAPLTTCPSQAPAALRLLRYEVFKRPLDMLVSVLLLPLLLIVAGLVRLIRTPIKSCSASVCWT